MNFERNRIIEGDCVRVLSALPKNSVDLIFADPPYNLQLEDDLHRPDMTRVDGVNDKWDRFDDFESYDDFTAAWLKACRQVLKPSGTIWVIGSYHNIFRVGRIMQDIGFWILNDVVWVKTNPMPNFRGVRFANAHETLIWASVTKRSKYTFNHQAMKCFNDDKQMRSDWWIIPLAKGPERLRDEVGNTAHSTQKPEALLYRVILSSTNPGDLVLDPFMGSGTTGVVAKRLHRDWLGIESDGKYIDLAQQRIDKVKAEDYDSDVFDVRDLKKKKGRVSFATILENGFVRPGQKMYFQKNVDKMAVIKPNAKIRTNDGFEGSIHQVGRYYIGGSPCNGWQNWYVRNGSHFVLIDEFREKYRLDNQNNLQVSIN